MATPPDAGRRLELFFTDQGRKLEVDATDLDPALLAETLVDAIGSQDVDDARRLIEDRATSSTPGVPAGS